MRKRKRQETERERERGGKRESARKGRVNATEPSGLLTHSHAATTNCTQTSAGGCGWLRSLSFRVSAFPFLSGESEASKLAFLSTGKCMSVCVYVRVCVCPCVCVCVCVCVRLHTHTHTLQQVSLSFQAILFFIHFFFFGWRCLLILSFFITFISIFYIHVREFRYSLSLFLFPCRF